MNFLKKFLASSTKDELAIIPSGQLFLKRAPGSPKSASECLYTDAVATVRETSVPHNYQLVIQRAHAEGEEQLRGDDDDDDDDDDESQDARVFLIDQTLNIHKFNRSGSWAIAWINQDDDDGESYEFVVDESVKSSEVDQFMKTTYCCEYERKYSKSSAGISADRLEEFVYDPENDDSLLMSSYKSLNSISTNALKDESETEEEDSIYEDAESLASRSSQRLQEMTEEPHGILIGESEAELRLYDPETESFTLQSQSASVSIWDLGNWEYWISVKDSGNINLGSIISPDINPVFNHEIFSFIFNTYTKDSAFSWLLRFESSQKLFEFQTAYMKAAYESNNKLNWTKAGAGDRSYVLDAFNTIEPDTDADTEASTSDSDDERYQSDNEEDYSNKALRTGFHKEKFSDSEDEDEEAEFKRSTKGEHNNNLTVAYKSNRAYVTRGSRIGVFKNTDDDELEFTTAIENLSIDGKRFTPKKVMLQTEDRAMVMQGDKNPDTLYRMDLERGKIVDEWKVRDELAVVDFGPSKKFDQLTGEQTFVGISKSGLFKIDPRLSGEKIVEGGLMSCSGKNDFSSFGTTENGYIAVASNKGDVRLYDRLGIRAKSLIPAIGDAIKSVVTSADGKWILCTCKTYLILIDSTIKEGANSGKLGFQKSFGKENRPKTRILRISNEHLAFMRQSTGRLLDFKKAVFNTGVGSKEQTIVTGSGPYSITWSLRKVLRGDADPYLIKRHESNVVADDFKYGTDKNIFVVLENDVGVLNKRAFRKPSRESYAYNPRSSI